MKPKFRTTKSDPRGVTRSLFYSPFNPSENFAIEDPLHLSSHPAVRKTGLAYSKYYGSGSPLSSKAPHLLQKKRELEETFSKMFHVESSLILPPSLELLSSLSKAFLPSQVYFLPASTSSLPGGRNCTYFSLENLTSLERELEKQTFDHLPIIYIPKVSPSHGRLDLERLAQIKKKCPFFLIVEDHYTFGLEGLYGSSKGGENSLIDLLVTHIPKAFGKMLTVISGSYDLLDHLFEYCLYNHSLFPCPAYLGMFEAMLPLLETMTEQRENLKILKQKLSDTFSEDATVSDSLITFHLSSYREKEEITKYLTDKGFLLPASAFKDIQPNLTLYLNYKLSNSAIHSITEARETFSKQIILESI